MRRTLFAFMTTTFVALTLCASTAGATTINFDNLLLGDFGGVIDGVTFLYAPSNPLDAGFSLVVSTSFETSSDPNYLGVQDGANEFFKPGDIVNLIFSAPISFLEVTFIGPSGTPDGAYGLETAGSPAVTSSSANLVVLGSGDEAFTLQLSPGSPFQSASLFSVAGVAPEFSIDDIVTREATNPVPEPATITLMLAPLAGLARSRWRSRRQR